MSHRLSLSAGLEDKQKLVWRESGLESSSSSPVTRGNEVYTINGSGVLSCGSIEERKVLWKLRLGGKFWATPVLVDQFLYCISAEGKSFVVELNDECKKGSIVGESEFGEDVLGSPAVADNAMFVRSHSHLWKIAK